MKNTIAKIASVILISALIAISAQAQTTAFTHDGKLTESGGPANGAYIMEFRLFNA